MSYQYMTLEARKMGFFAFTSTNQVSFDAYFMINMRSCNLFVILFSVSGVLPVLD